MPLTAYTKGILGDALCDESNVADLEIENALSKGISNTLAKTANYTLAAADSGLDVTVDTSGGAVVFTLPSTVLGLTFTVSVVGIGSAVNLSPAAADNIQGGSLAPGDDKDFILATPAVGDFITVIADGAVGWKVTAIGGTWTGEA